MTTKQAKILCELIHEYTECKVSHSFKGASDPADWPSIDSALRQARKKLNAYIKSLIKEGS